MCTPDLMFSYASSARERGVQVIIAAARHGSCTYSFAVATVAINNATNAGLLAVRLLGVGDVGLRARMAQYLEDRRDEVLVRGEKLEKGGWEEYLAS